MKTRAWLGFLLVLAVSGCGYHAPGAGDAWVGGGGRTLYVELFANRTVEPYLDEIMTAEVAGRLSRSRQVELTENQQAAELLLDGTITQFESRAVAYDTNDAISEYMVKIVVKARLVRQSDGVVLWQEEFRRSENSPAILDKSLQKEGEGVAARVVTRRIAEDIMARLVTAF